MLVVSFLIQCEKDDPNVVKINDDKFLEALIDQGVDTNADGIISPAEAELITELYISDYEIANLAGIEAFVNLAVLICDSNKLTRLDLSKHVNLENLSCSGNLLTLVKVSGNTALRLLDCRENYLLIF